jgi:hypothetical protein
MTKTGTFERGRPDNELQEGSLEICVLYGTSRVAVMNRVSGHRPVQGNCCSRQVGCNDSNLVLIASAVSAQVR